jgi:phage terminase small subunit
LQYYQNIAIAFNNHFAGFSSQSANVFLKLIDKPEIKDWTKKIEKQQNNSVNVDYKHQTKPF